MSDQALRLSELQPAEKAIIIGFSPDCDQVYRRTLMSRGLLPNSEVTIVRIAPLGDPIELLVRDYRLTLRRSEAACLVVQPQ